MKKLFTLLFFIAIASAGMAQKGTSSFNQGDNLVNIGIGIGTPFFGSGYSSSLPVNPSVSYERGITSEISVGGQLSYASSKYDYSVIGSAYSFKESATYVGVRGAYHFNDLLSLDRKIDVYGGASLGYVIVSVSDNLGSSASAGSAAGLGAFAGGKYFFTSQTAVYAEVGYQSLSFLNIGLAFKF